MSNFLPDVPTPVVALHFIALMALFFPTIVKNVRRYTLLKKLRLDPLRRRTNQSATVVFAAERAPAHPR